MTRLNLLVLRTQFIHKTVDFYATVFQTPFTRHTDHGPPHYGTEVGDVYVEIYPTHHEQKQLDAVGLEVPDMENILKYIDSSHILSHEDTSARLRDPDGRLVFLEERAK